MNTITELTPQNFETEVLQGQSLVVVVDFYAPWCGPCRMLGAVLEKLAGEFAGRLKLARANVDEMPAWAEGFEITSVPTLLLFRAGEPVDQVVGYPGERQVKAWLATAAAAEVST